MRGQNRFLANAAWGLALLLGHASMLLGMMVALAWMLAFAILLPQKGNGWMDGQPLSLPIEPPLIGLGIGAMGLLVARWSREPVARFSIAGLVFNALSLALAILSIVAFSRS
jgi:hypothetical protein